MSAIIYYQWNRLWANMKSQGQSVSRKLGNYLLWMEQIVSQYEIPGTNESRKLGNYLLPMEQIASQYEIPGTKCEQKTGELSTINGTDCEPIWNPRDRNESRKLCNYLLPMEQIVSRQCNPREEVSRCGLTQDKYERLDESASMVTNYLHNA